MAGKMLQIRLSCLSKVRVETCAVSAALAVSTQGHAVDSSHIVTEDFIC